MSYYEVNIFQVRKDIKLNRLFLSLILFGGSLFFFLPLKNLETYRSSLWLYSILGLLLLFTSFILFFFGLCQVLCVLATKISVSREGILYNEPFYSIYCVWTDFSEVTITKNDLLLKFSHYEIKKQYRLLAWLYRNLIFHLDRGTIPLSLFTGEWSTMEAWTENRVLRKLIDIVSPKDFLEDYQLNIKVVEIWGRLKSQEKNVVKLVCMNYTDEQIIKSMKISEAKLEKLMEGIFTKAKVSERNLIKNQFERIV